MTMRLRVLGPVETLVDTEVRKVIAEATDGWFCLLPRHVDTVTSLVASVLTYEQADGREVYVAVDEGVLVKCDRDVQVATPRAVTGAGLDELEAAVETAFRVRDEREQHTRAAMRRLEATFLRGLLDLEGVHRG
jgi:F-type H+-transporting ATPase subunit epsilon